MKKSIIVCSLLLTTALFVGCKNTSKTETKSTSVKVYYSCPMHPEVKSDKPGKCSKCGGMDLEKHEE